MKRRTSIVVVSAACFMAGCWVLAGLEDRTLLDEAAEGGSPPDATTESAAPDVTDAGASDVAAVVDGTIAVDAACEAGVPPRNASVVKCTKAFNCSLPLETCCPLAGECAMNDSADCVLTSWICSAGANCPATDAGSARCCATALVKKGDTCPPVVELGSTTCQSACPRDAITLCDRDETCPPGQQCRPLAVQVDGGTLPFGTCAP